MATNPIVTNFQKLYEKLPKDLQDAIYSVDSSEAIQRIANKYSLLIDKMGFLAEATGLVMLGIAHPKDFISNLSQKLGVDRETARKIAEEVNQQIFQKVRESLRKIHGITDESGSRKQEAGIKEETLKQSEVKPSIPLVPQKPISPPPIIKEPSKEEVRPLEIRPIKSVEDEVGIRKQEAGIKKEILKTKPIEQAKPVPELEKIRVMPTSPPPDLPFLETKEEKKLQPESGSMNQEIGVKKEMARHKSDPYREQIE